MANGCVTTPILGLAIGLTLPKGKLNIPHPLIFIIILLIKYLL
jgi:hypothetical protein